MAGYCSIHVLVRDSSFVILFVEQTKYYSHLSVFRHLVMLCCVIC